MNSHEQKDLVDFWIRGTSHVETLAQVVFATQKVQEDFNLNLWPCLDPIHRLYPGGQNASQLLNILLQKCRVNYMDQLNEKIRAEYFRPRADYFRYIGGTFYDILAHIVFVIKMWNQIDWPVPSQLSQKDIDLCLDPIRNLVGRDKDLYELLLEKRSKQYKQHIPFPVRSEKQPTVQVDETKKVVQVDETKNVVQPNDETPMGKKPFVVKCHSLGDRGIFCPHTSYYKNPVKMKVNSQVEFTLTRIYDLYVAYMYKYICEPFTHKFFRKFLDENQVNVDESKLGQNEEFKILYTELTESKPFSIQGLTPSDLSMIFAIYHVAEGTPHFKDLLLQNTTFDVQDIRAVDLHERWNLGRYKELLEWMSSNYSSVRLDKWIGKKPNQEPSRFFRHEGQDYAVYQLSSFAIFDGNCPIYYSKGKKYDHFKDLDAELVFLQDQWIDHHVWSRNQNDSLRDTMTTLNNFVNRFPDELKLSASQTSTDFSQISINELIWFFIFLTRDPPKQIREIWAYYSGQVYFEQGTHELFTKHKQNPIRLGFLYRIALLVLFQQDQSNFCFTERPAMFKECPLENPWNIYDVLNILTPEEHRGLLYVSFKDQISPFHGAKYPATKQYLGYMYQESSEYYPKERHSDDYKVDNS